MTTYIDDRGPYMLEQIANADARRKSGSYANEWANELTVSRNGKFAYAKSPLPVWNYTILFLPHRGEGEPRPQP